jgi:hypothetical protein
VFIKHRGVPKAGYANTEVARRFTEEELEGGLILAIGVEDLGYDIFAAGDAVFEEDEAEDDEHSGAGFD